MLKLSVCLAVACLLALVCVDREVTAATLNCDPWPGYRYCRYTKTCINFNAYKCCNSGRLCPRKTMKCCLGGCISARCKCCANTPCCGANAKCLGRGNKARCSITGTPWCVGTSCIH